MGSNWITSFVNSTVKNMSLNLRKEKYTRSRKICQLSNDIKVSHVSLVWWKLIFLQRRQVHLGRFSALVTSSVKNKKNTFTCEPNKQKHCYLWTQQTRTLLPVNPGRQEQLKPATRSVQRLSKWHGRLRHSSYSNSQWDPETQTTSAGPWNIIHTSENSPIVSHQPGL